MLALGLTAWVALTAVLERMDNHSCYHGDPKIRAAAVQTAAQEKSTTLPTVASRQQRFDAITVNSKQLGM